MKMNRKAAAFITAGLMAISLCVPASFSVSAEGETANSITITPAKEGAHNYKAYQIFKGTLSGGETNPLDSEPKPTPYVLSDIKWGDNAADDFLVELKKDNSFKPSETADNIFKDAATAEDVAKILKGYANNSDVAIAFAKFAGEHTKGDAKAADAEAPYEMNNLAAGYYLVKDEEPIGTSTPRTLNLLCVVGAVEVTTKEDLPTLDKKITGDTAKDNGKANAVSIGDKIPYELTSAVPNMTGYDKYFFVINDTLAPGLTFNDDVQVSVDGTEYKNTDGKTYFTVQTGADAKDGDTQYSFQIVFNDFYGNFKDKAGKDIKITYSATLNQGADRTVNGNENTASLTYSNNPNVTPTGVNEPEGTDPKGKTPDSQTKTYTANIKLWKFEKNASGTNQSLSGAKFRIEGNSANIVLINGTAYKKNNDATENVVYKLKNGTFTPTAPNGDEDKYDGTDKYVAVENVDKETSKTDICMEAYVKSDGTLEFGGLGAGTYMITEVEAPSGYNKLTDPIYITISGDPKFKSEDGGPNWSATKKIGDGGTEAAIGFDENNNATAYFEIENKQGSTLPSTGGIGTKLFFIFGAAMAIGSGIYLVTKKRMAGVEE